MGMFSVRRFEEVTSTNDPVKEELDAGGAEGFVCRARTQTGGYGRQGRLWTSPAGGLYQSMLLRPQVDPRSLPTLGFVVGLAMRAALLRIGGLAPETVSLKWPNDLMAGDAKLAGISLESRAGGVCVGMGVNVFRPTGQLLADGKYTPAFFNDLALGSTETGDIAFADGATFQSEQQAIDFIGDAILDAFEDCYPVWLECGFAKFADEFRSCSYLQGKRVRMQLLNGQAIASGTVVGVDEQGYLLIDDGSGVKQVSSGEAHLL